MRWSNNEYDSWIDLNTKKWGCLCEYASIWRGKRKNPCRHIRLFMYKLGDKYKEMLKELVDFKCEQCKKVFNSKDLQIHRIIRSNVNGEYIPSNIKILCYKCHRLMHSGEFK